MIDVSAEREARAKAGRSPGRTVRLDVTWHHDRLHVVLPVDRDRTLPWLLLPPIALMLVNTSSVYAGLALLVLPLVFRDRRRSTLSIDRDFVTVERWHLGRSRRVRIPLHQVVVSTGDFCEQLCLNDRDHQVKLRWDGSREALVWLVDQIERAKAAASPLGEPPAPPSELSRLRRLGSGSPRSGEDHLRV